MTILRILSTLMSLLIAFPVMAQTHIAVRNLTRSDAMGLSYRYLLAFDQTESADGLNNYSAWLIPIPFISKYSDIDIIVSYDDFVFQQQQCEFRGTLTGQGLSLVNKSTNPSHFRCEIIGNQTNDVTINVYQI